MRIFYFIILFFPFSIFAQDGRFITVQGNVTDIEYGMGVENHLVEILLEQDTTFQIYELLTVQDGSFDQDSIFLPDNVDQVIAMTYDCNDVLHSQAELNIPSIDIYNFTFEICDSTNYNDLQAFFDYELIGEHSVAFYDLSTGDISSWCWDFGDGNCIYEQNPIYVFEDYGVFEVCLTVEGNSPTMQSTFCMPVEVINDSCFVYFDYSFTDVPLTIQFEQQMSENIDSFFWDFGDGNMSEDFNPVHQYEMPGYYPVILMGTDFESGCQDEMLLEIEVIFELTADFSFYLDTISGEPNTYYFINESEGEPDTYYWDFGNGDFSFEENPVYHFDEYGEYPICLTVRRIFSNEIEYNDTFCTNLQTENYFDFGGQVFLGLEAMNNVNGDTTVVDYGVASLYRAYADQVFKVDSIAFSTFGYYWFSDVREGDYLVRIDLEEESQHYHQFIPAYHSEAEYWQEASLIYLHDDYYAYDVSLEEIDELLDPGIFTIQGNVNFPENYRANDQDDTVLIHLLNDQGDFLTYTYTDESGNFSFVDLPEAFYQLHAELAGFSCDFEMVYLDASNPNQNGVELNLNQTPLGYQMNNIPQLKISEIYPNPVSDKLMMNLWLTKPRLMEFVIYNINGQKLGLFRKNTLVGENHIEISTENLEDGFYILQLNTKDSGEIFKTLKFIK